MRSAWRAIGDLGLLVRGDGAGEVGRRSTGDVELHELGALLDVHAALNQESPVTTPATWGGDVDAYWDAIKVPIEVSCSTHWSCVSPFRRSPWPRAGPFAPGKDLTSIWLDRELPSAKSAPKRTAAASDARDDQTPGHAASRSPASAAPLPCEAKLRSSGRQSAPSAPRSPPAPKPVRRARSPMAGRAPVSRKRILTPGARWR